MPNPYSTGFSTTVYWLRIEGVVHELYDVVALRNVAHPKLLGFKSEEINRTLRVEESGL